MTLESIPDFYLQASPQSAQLWPVNDLPECARDLSYNVVVLDGDGAEFSTLTLEATLFKASEAEDLGYGVANLLCGYSDDTAYLFEVLYREYEHTEGLMPDTYLFRPEIGELLDFPEQVCTAPPHLLYVHTDSIVDTPLGVAALQVLLRNFSNGVAVVCVAGLDDVEGSRPVFDNTERRVEMLLGMGFHHVPDSPFMILDLDDEYGTSFY